MQQIPFLCVTLCGKIQKFREITQIHKFVCFHGKTLKKIFLLSFSFVNGEYNTTLWPLIIVSNILIPLISF